MPSVKRIYIYKDSHLPEIGWLQACFKCEAITGKYFLFQSFTKKETLYEFYRDFTCNVVGVVLCWDPLRRKPGP